MAEFRIGDRVMHRLCGAGTMVSIAKQGDNGMAKDHYAIELGPGQARLMTPGKTGHVSEWSGFDGLLQWRT